MDEPLNLCEWKVIAAALMLVLDKFPPRPGDLHYQERRRENVALARAKVLLTIQTKGGVA